MKKIWIGVFLALAMGVSPAMARDTMELWNHGCALRGVNIWQSKSYGIIGQAGDGHVGPRFTQEDFDLLAGLGANLVNISHPGLFDESGAPDMEAARNLDALLDMVLAADMFAVISVRTGPGRNEFTFVRDEAGDWFAPGQLDESVWTDPEKQRQWEDMWRFMAERYRDHPAVAAYTLMVEPNACEVLGEDGEALEPEEFYARYEGKTPDWNAWYPRLVAAIREKDPATPILVGCEGYASLDWLLHLKPAKDPYLVYDVHPYTPFDYVFQEPGAPAPYPGTTDWDWDGSPEPLDRERLAQALADIAQAPVPVAAMELGAHRNAPNLDAYLTDLAGILESLNCNWAAWSWNPKGFSNDGDEFVLRRGPDLNGHQDSLETPQLLALKKLWSRNTLSPSGMR